MSARLTEQEYEDLVERRKRTLPANGRSERGETPTLKVVVAHDYKAELVQQLGLVGIDVEPEFKPIEKRRFRADWRVTGRKILIEFEGGLFHKGKQGHSSVTGILRDIEKYNLCALAGWTVIRVAPNHVVSGDALRWIEKAVEREQLT